MTENEPTQDENTGYSFLATVISSGILGYGIDHFADTAPWGLLGMMVIGLIYATYKAQKTLNPDKDKKGGKKT